MFEQYIGPIPAGCDIHHVCETPLCGNPAHLQAVPHNTNRALGGRNGNAQRYGEKTDTPEDDFVF